MSSGSWTTVDRVPLVNGGAEDHALSWAIARGGIVVTVEDAEQIGPEILGRNSEAAANELEIEVMEAARALDQRDPILAELQAMHGGADLRRDNLQARGNEEGNTLFLHLAATILKQDIVVVHIPSGGPLGSGNLAEREAGRAVATRFSPQTWLRAEEVEPDRAASMRSQSRGDALGAPGAGGPQEPVGPRSNGKGIRIRDIGVESRISCADIWVLRLDTRFFTMMARERVAAMDRTDTVSLAQMVAAGMATHEVGQPPLGRGTTRTEQTPKGYAAAVTETPAKRQRPSATPSPDAAQAKKKPSGDVKTPDKADTNGAAVTQKKKTAAAQRGKTLRSGSAGPTEMDPVTPGQAGGARNKRNLSESPEEAGPKRGRGATGQDEEVEEDGQWTEVQGRRQTGPSKPSLAKTTSEPTPGRCPSKKAGCECDKVAPAGAAMVSCFLNGCTSQGKKMAACNLLAHLRKHIVEGRILNACVKNFFKHAHKEVVICGGCGLPFTHKDHCEKYAKVARTQVRARGAAPPSKETTGKADLAERAAAAAERAKETAAARAVATAAKAVRSTGAAATATATAAPATTLLGAAAAARGLQEGTTDRKRLAARATAAVTEPVTATPATEQAAAATTPKQPGGTPAASPPTMEGPSEELMAELDGMQWDTILAPSAHDDKPMVPRKWGKSVHTAWRSVVRAVLPEAEKQGRRGERGLKLLFLLPKILLRRSTTIRFGKGDPRHSAAKVLAARLLSPWVQLGEFLRRHGASRGGPEEGSQEPDMADEGPQPPAPGPGPGETKGTASRRSKRAVALAKAGQLSRALRTLAEDARPMTDENGLMDKLRELHPEPVQGARDRGVPLPTGGDAPTLGNVGGAFAKMAPLAAAGPSGWVKEMVDARDVELFKMTLDKLAFDDIGADAASHIFGGTLVPLDKGEGRVRPIVVGEFFPKLAAKAIQLAAAGHLSNVFTPQRQFGVAVSKGAEIMGHAAREAFGQGASLFKLDFTNAYNSISREVIAAALEKDTSEAALRIRLHFDRRYPRKGWCPRLAVRLKTGVEWVEARTGIQQGDPLGPALFAYGLSEVMARARQGLDPTEVSDLAYLDDVVLIGEIRHTIRAAEAVAKSAHELGSGLRLNWTKCQLCTPEAEAAHTYFETHPPKERPEIVTEGVVVLGIPIGRDTFAADHWNRYVQETSGPRVRAIDSLKLSNTAQFKLALLRYCAVPLAGHMLRTTHPYLTGAAAEAHDGDIIDSFRRILNAPREEVFTPEVIAQIQRPVKLGGLGLSSAAKAAEAAYVASVVSTHKQVLEIPFIAKLLGIPHAPPVVASREPTAVAATTRPPSLPTTEAPATAAFTIARRVFRDIQKKCSSFDGAFPGSTNEVISMKDKLALPANLEEFDGEDKPQQRMSKAVNLVEWLHTYKAASLEVKATMLSRTQRGAMEAFTVIPFEKELVLPDYAFAYGMRKVLGLSTPQDVDGLQCTCGAAKSTNQHVNNCRRGGGMIQRHDRVVLTLGAMLCTAGLHPAIDKRATYFEAGNGGPDIAVDNFPKAGLDAFVEFSIINPTQQRCCTAAASTYLSAAREREAAKRAKYQLVGEANLRSVWGVAMETTGAFGPGLQSLIKAAVAVDTEAMTPEMAPWLSASPRAYWSQRISVAFHKAAFLMAEQVAATAIRNAQSAP